MPIRFQVDPDFYDHPKSIDLSDAAVALWTRAGSYSAAKLLDGFVPCSVLPRLSKSHAEAAEELVRAGLWKKARGGYRFHEWELRNLTRTRVEHERKVDRERKHTAREIKAAKATPQVTGDNVRPESDRNPAGNPTGVPSMSVSVSVSKAVGSKEASDHVSNADENNVYNIQDEPRSKAYPANIWKIARAYAAKVNPSNPGNIAGHILNATQTWELETIAQAIEKMARENRAVGADSLRIELNAIGCDKNGIQRFPDGTYVDWNTGQYCATTGNVIGGGGYRSGKREWRE